MEENLKVGDVVIVTDPSVAYPQLQDKVGVVREVFNKKQGFIELVSNVDLGFKYGFSLKRKYFPEVEEDLFASAFYLYDRHEVEIYTISEMEAKLNYLCVGSHIYDFPENYFEDLK